MGKVYLHCKMEGTTAAPISMTKRTAMGFFRGQMEGSSKATGEMGNNMAEDSILRREELLEKADEKTARGQVGCHKNLNKNLNEFCLSIDYI